MFGQGTQDTALTDAPQANKPNTIKKSLGIIACVLAVAVLAVVAFNFSFINNFVHKTFFSPEKYYRYIEKNTVKKWASQTGEWYDAYMDANLLYTDDVHIKSELSVEVSPKGQSVLALAKLMGYDLTWFQSGTIKMDSISTKDADMVEGHISINQQEIFSGSLIADSLNQNLYIQMPELTETYLGINVTEILEKQGQELQKEMAFKGNQAEVMPDRKTVEKLTRKYLLLMLDYVEDVEKEEDILEIDDVSQKVTALTATIDNGTMQDMWKAILEEVKNDEEIEKIIKDRAKALDPEADTDHVYEEFLQKFKESAEGFHEYFFEYVEKTMVMTIYVDNKGNIRGRSIKWIEDVSTDSMEFTNTMTISMLMPERGRQFGYELSLEKVFGSGYGEDMDIRISGSGYKSGAFIDGDFIVKYNDTSVLDLAVSDLDTNKFKRSQLDGTITMQLNKGLGKLLLGSEQGTSALESIRFVLQGSVGKNEAKTSLDLCMEEDSLVTFTVSSQTEHKAEVNIPAEEDVVMAGDMDEFQDWFDEIDWDELISHLEETDLPNQIIDAIDDLRYELEYLMRSMNRPGVSIYDML